MAKQIAKAQDFIIARYEGESFHAAAPDDLEDDDAGRSPWQLMSTVNDVRGKLVATIGEQEVIFRDVEADAWYAPYVAALVADGIAQGYTDAEGQPKGEFGTANAVTYAEVLKMALEASGKSVDGLSPTRNRSARGTWAEAYVAKADAMNLSLFSTALDVHSPATRGEVIQTILEVMGIPIGVTPGKYRDLPASHPNANAIGTATWYGLIQGDTDDDGKPTGMIRPDAQINRAEVAKIIAIVKGIVE